MCRSIAELYDPTCDAFIIDGEPLTMTSRDMEQILARKDLERTALQGTVNLEGNLPLLQFWFWEKRRLDRLDRTIDYSKRDTPLVQYWDEQKARKVCAIFDKHGLEAGETVHDLKEPWEVPRSPTPEMFDELPPTDSKLVLALHDTVLRMRKELMEQHLQTRVQMLRKFRQLEKENSDMRNLLYTNLNTNDYWSRPEYDYNAGDKSVPSPLRGRDLASDFDGAQDDTTSEHKEFDKEDALKSNVALPVNVKDTHWYVSVVNAKKDVKLTQPIMQDDIPRFRKQLSALLVESTLNSKGPRNNEE
ncbi:epstein-barr virus ebna-1-like protein [Hordeum vulgare]|nr:epstein-barr virus ebna-1-like protein [Hordeum vulgare]